MAQPDDKKVDDGATDDKKPKVQFSAEQQDKLQELINEAFAKGAKKTEEDLAKATKTITELTAKVEELTKAPSKKDDKKADDKKADDKKADDNDADGRTRLAKMQAQFDELLSNFNTVKSERDSLKGEKDKAVQDARKARFATTFDEAAGDTFFKNGTVRLELSEQLRQEEDGSITVLNPKTGQPRLNTDMEPFTLKDLLAEYAKNNPHMVKVKVEGGSGAEETRKLETGVVKKSIKDMTPAEIKALEKRVMAGERIPVE